jgi:hypothetical protein
MKRNTIIAVSALLLMSSCGTYTGAGAYTGVTLGSILGSAIGGLSDGPRGSDVGTIIGMAGGAAIGAAIGNAADQRAQDEVIAHREAVKARRAQQGDYQGNNQGNYNDNYNQGNYNNDNYSQAPATRGNYGQGNNTQTPATQGSVNQGATTSDNGNYGSGLDETNSGDDRIYDFNGSDYNGNYTAQKPTTTLPATSSVENLAGAYSYTPSIEIRNARFVDDNQDNVISRGELCKVIFEVINKGQSVLYDVQPTVVEATGNKHIFISPGIHVEKINPGKGIRYTALVKADNRLKDGTAKICISVIQGDNNKISKVSEFNIPTRSK